MLYSVLHAPAYPPSMSDWRRYRHVITEMYIAKNMTLKEVHSTMVTRFRFKASHRMYKQRLKQWGLYKNNCARILLAGKARGKDISRNMPLNLENGDLVSLLINTRKFVELALQQQFLWAGTVSVPHFQKASNELCYLGGSITEGPASEDTWDTIHYGLTLLRMHQYVGARQCFDKACDFVKTTLSDSPADMFRKLLMVLGTHQWQGFEHYRQSILDYTAKLASNVLGHYHPIAIILQQMRRGNCLESAAEGILKCSHDIFLKELGPGHGRVVRFKGSISVVLRRQKEYQSSENYVREAILDGEKHNGYNAKETRSSLRRLASLYIHQQRYEDAENICIEALTRGFRFAAANQESLDEVSIRTLQNLAYLARMRGHQERSDEWARHEVYAALRRWGPAHIRDMLKQAGCSQIAQACSDEVCARKLLDLCEPIWSGTGKAPPAADQTMISSHKISAAIGQMPKNTVLFEVGIDPGSGH